LITVLNCVAFAGLEMEEALSSKTRFPGGIKYEQIFYD